MCCIINRYKDKCKKKDKKKNRRGDYMQLYKALDVSRYIINYCNKKKSPVSNLQLQKILYYVQAAFLVEEDRPCFSDEIINWSYGPVVEIVYREYRNFGHNVITEQNKYEELLYDKAKNQIIFKEKTFSPDIFSNQDIVLIDKITDIYYKCDAFDLVEKTHNEDPWKNSNVNEEITNKIIKEYYSNNPDELYNKSSV